MFRATTRLLNLHSTPTFQGLRPYSKLLFKPPTFNFASFSSSSSQFPKNYNRFREQSSPPPPPEDEVDQGNTYSEIEGDAPEHVNGVFLGNDEEKRRQSLSDFKQYIEKLKEEDSSKFNRSNWDNRMMVRFITSFIRRYLKYIAYFVFKVLYVFVSTYISHIAVLVVFLLL